MFGLRPASIILAGCLVLSGLSGCVHYTPVSGEFPGAGDEIRVVLTPEASERISSRTGRNLQQFEGRTAGSPTVGDSLRIMVSLGDPMGRVGPDTPRATIAVHRSEITSLDRKEISRTRTAMAGVAVGAVVFSVYRGVRGERGLNRGGEEEIEPPPVELYCFLAGLLRGAPGPCGD
ncbi:MAG: hypothetical protein EA350_01870 [Gemmatimonadales bacterium]|nr:MAG: hypothetical protein EA350_01870 [Gemmatimonadales bacterium]